MTNYEILTNSREKPLVLELRDPYCNHCRAFQPTWDKLVGESRFVNRVNFGDIDCLENKKLCKSLGVGGYPTVLYIDQEGRVEYDGVMSFEGIELFIEKQLSFPVKMVENETELLRNIEMTNQTSVFYIEVETTDDEKFQALKAAASVVRNRTCVFIGKFSSNTKLRVFRSPDYQIEYTGDWSNASINSFVMQNIFCLLPPLTSQLFDEFAISDKLMLLAFIQKHQYKEVYSLVKEMSQPYQVFYQMWTPRDYLTRYIGISEAALPQFILLDTNRSRWAFVPVNDSAGLQHWCNSLDLQKLQWKGPGDGPLRDLWQGLYAVKAAGGAAMVVLILCMCVFVAIVVVIIVQCYQMYQEELKLE